MLGLLLASAQAPSSSEVRLPATADASICVHPSERSFNTGAATRIRLKGNEHLLVLDFDASSLAGLRVADARLFLHPAGPVKLKTLGVSTVSSRWKEGDGNGREREGAVTFLVSGDGPWPGGDFLAVSFGRGGSAWEAADLREEAEGWISTPVPPAFVEAMAAGRSFGLAVSDEKGQTRWNNDFFSREEPGAGPYLLVRTEPGEPRPFSPSPRDPMKPEERTAAPFVLPPRVQPTGAAPLRAAGGRSCVILSEGATVDPTADLPDGPAPQGWDGKTLRLRAARGEHVGVMIAVAWGEEGRPWARVLLLGMEGTARSVNQVVWIPASPRGVADPLVPLVKGVEREDTSLTVAMVPGRRLALYHLEWGVPLSTPPGEKRGTVLVEFGGAHPDEAGSPLAEIPVSIRVEGASIPDRPTFAVSLNTYGSPGGNSTEERAYFRLAHENRTTLAPVPYSQSGRVHPGAAPELERSGDEVRVKSWKEWDERFGPLFDASAFEGLPRAGVPIEHFLLPLHENWPLPIDEFYAYRGRLEDHWRDAPPVGQAFSPAYPRALEGISTALAQHLHERGWTDTLFLPFLNNKVDYRARGSGTSWWLLDEPAWRDDFLALRWFGERFRAGLSLAKSKAKVAFRVDLSRPEWRREHLDGVVGLLVCNALRESGGVALETARRNGETVWSYGEPPPPGAGPDRTRAWCLRAWLDGADGMVPWQSVGTAESWRRPEATALLYPAPPDRGRGPLPSLRLKMLRRAAEDAELLNLLVARGLATRDGIARAIGDSLDFETCERLRSAALGLLAR
ncbi:MAG TPA: hypothetical protein VFI25_17150 [Planctomycetota bacterium]|nr:hypothetical protein [Planctomycetota bacterium]